MFSSTNQWISIVFVIVVLGDRRVSCLYDEYYYDYGDFDEYSFDITAAETMSGDDHVTSFMDNPRSQVSTESYVPSANWPASSIEVTTGQWDGLTWQTEPTSKSGIHVTMTSSMAYTDSSKTVIITAPYYSVSVRVSETLTAENQVTVVKSTVMSSERFTSFVSYINPTKTQISSMKQLGSAESVSETDLETGVIKTIGENESNLHEREGETGASSTGILGGIGTNIFETMEGNGSYAYWSFDGVGSDGSGTIVGFGSYIHQTVAGIDTYGHETSDVFGSYGYKSFDGFSATDYGTQGGYLDDDYGTESGFLGNDYGTQGGFWDDDYGTESGVWADDYGTESGFWGDDYGTESGFWGDDYGMESGFWGDDYGMESGFFYADYGTESGFWGDDYGMESGIWGDDYGTESGFWGDDYGTERGFWGDDYGTESGFWDDDYGTESGICDVRETDNSDHETINVLGTIVHGSMGDFSQLSDKMYRSDFMTNSQPSHYATQSSRLVGESDDGTGDYDEASDEPKLEENIAYQSVKPEKSLQIISIIFCLISLQ